MAEKYKVIGLMSGTSMDGLDIAYCEFEKAADSWSYKIVCAETIEYNDYWKNLLKNAENLSAYELTLSNISYGNFLGSESRKFISKYNLQPDFISSHGHTIFHQPEQKITLQIGSGASIAAQAMLTVISDFRTLDVALGGQGAPLVPIGDKTLFKDFGACLNLGGFANISYNTNGVRVAYDVCPVNIVFNFYSEKLGFPYDKDGIFAMHGKIDKKLLSSLNEIEYYIRIAPKSLGKEWVINTFLKLTEHSGLDVKDIMCTVAEHVSIQIASEIEKSCSQKTLLTGGGVFNKYLINRINHNCKNETIIPDNLTVNYKEALIFAFLGVLRFRNEVNCLSSVTGALRDNIGGVIYYI
jgi:anhydro-N-acetylmuramic acid kinase